MVEAREHFFFTERTLVANLVQRTGLAPLKGRAPNSTYAIKGI